MWSAAKICHVAPFQDRTFSHTPASACRRPVIHRGLSSLGLSEGPCTVEDLVPDPLAAEGRMQAEKWSYSGSSDQERVPEASI
jgi:hypothetical protein